MAVGKNIQVLNLRGTASDVEEVGVGQRLLLGIEAPEIHDLQNGRMKPL